jgi:hypothetical protein
MDFNAIPANDFGRHLRGVGLNLPRLDCGIGRDDRGALVVWNGPVAIL